MVLAVVADVHSNVFAFRAAAEELKKFSPDKWVFLGDLVGVGAFPEETVNFAKTFKNAVFVKGNHDIFASEKVSPYKKGDVRGKLALWQYFALSSSAREFLKQMPDIASFNAENLKVTCVHYAKSENGWFAQPKYLPTDEDISDIFRRVQGDVVLFGHEHTGSFHKIGGRHFLNFGTCGNFLLPNTARAGIVEISDNKLAYKSVNAYYDDSYARKRNAEILYLLEKNSNNFNKTAKTDFKV